MQLLNPGDASNVQTHLRMVGDDGNNFLKIQIHRLDMSKTIKSFCGQGRALLVGRQCADFIRPLFFDMDQ